MWIRVIGSTRFKQSTCNIPFVYSEFIFSCSSRSRTSRTPQVPFMGVHFVRLGGLEISLKSTLEEMWFLRLSQETEPGHLLCTEAHPRPRPRLRTGGRTVRATSLGKASGERPRFVPRGIRSPLILGLHVASVDAGRESTRVKRVPIELPDWVKSIDGRGFQILPRSASVTRVHKGRI